MRYLILLFYFISLSVFAGESNKSSHDHHDHSSHDHKGDQTFVDGQKLNVDQKKLDKFLKSLCLLYTSPSPRDLSTSRMPSSA